MEAEWQTLLNQLKKHKDIGAAPSPYDKNTWKRYSPCYSHNYPDAPLDYDYYRQNNLYNYDLFIEAVLLNLPNTVDCMLANGADPNHFGSTRFFQIQGEPPILSAVMRHEPPQNDYTRIISSLLQYGAISSAIQSRPTSFRGFDAIQYAVEENMEDIIQIIYDAAEN